MDAVKALQAGDLFHRFSHVVKCGSDVQFLIFEVLPQLPVGVFVHFHDVFDSFEYPPDCLLKGWSWNEDYILRAFLSFNNSWEIASSAIMPWASWRDFFAEHMPLCLENPGREPLHPEDGLKGCRPLGRDPDRC